MKKAITGHMLVIIIIIIIGIIGIALFYIFVFKGGEKLSEAYSQFVQGFQQAICDLFPSWARGFVGC